ncbi:hypothetical protein CYMTET_22594 [Cymbomonas tetramitiformis]|uniref:Tetratricopeptide repeat protein n=1 Tax=Cymbomonas tetramitiformis TaxID=36881 RepID=A0AAE0FZW8_9CHLO|nr:hypothetical protein CYMTET_22594 [Cymbomonas tetramitiformis]
MRHEQPASVPIKLLLGHYHALNEHWQQALEEYTECFKEAPDEPLVPLCTGTALLHFAMSRKVPSRDRAVKQAFAFLNCYTRLKQAPQENAYNLGRACHQLGLNTLAVKYYEKALACKVVVPGEVGQPASEALENRRFCDLRRETAHNLSLIYCNSGAPNLARAVLRQYGTI